MKVVILLQINTKPFGPVEIDENNILTFENGLVGFEEMRKFVLLGSDAEPLSWLQSLDDEKLAFVVIPPQLVYAEYSPAIDKTELASLEIAENDNVLYYSIVVVPDDIKKMTANLRAPIVINGNKKLAKQMVLNDDRYKVRELVFREQ